MLFGWLHVIADRVSSVAGRCDNLYIRIGDMKDSSLVGSDYVTACFLFKAFYAYGVVEMAVCGKHVSQT